MQDLRYGENPHQTGARYREVGTDLVVGRRGAARRAWRSATSTSSTPTPRGGSPTTWPPRSAGRPCAIIKHANPCGAAVAGDAAPTPTSAPSSATSARPSAGIVALSHPVDDATVERMVAAAQADVVIAPGYGDGVIERARQEAQEHPAAHAPRRPAPDAAPDPPAHRLAGSCRTPTTSRPTRDDWRVVTKREPTEAEWADAELAWRLVGWVKSNSIVLVKDGTAWGIGAGQQNRVEAGQIAAAKAAGRAKGGACASDAFYPFPDGIEAAADAGVAVVIQPGGSVKDEDNIAKADELGLAMVFTGERHFLH